MSQWCFRNKHTWIYRRVYLVAWLANSFLLAVHLYSFGLWLPITGPHRCGFKISLRRSDYKVRKVSGYLKNTCGSATQWPGYSFIKDAWRGSWGPPPTVKRDHSQSNVPLGGLASKRNNVGFLQWLKTLNSVFNLLCLNYILFPHCVYNRRSSLHSGTRN